MRILLPLLLLPLLLLPIIATAEPVKFSTLTTKDGKEYTNAIVTEKRADGISIRHDGGTARIPFEKLTGVDKHKVGGFDPAEAEKARAADAKAQAELDAALAKEGDKGNADLSPVAKVGKEAAKEPVRTPIPNKDKLTVKRTTAGKGMTQLDVSARAGDKPLRVAWVFVGDPKRNGSMTIKPWETKTANPRSSADDYTVTAYEDGVVVDVESPRQKSGLGSDTKLR